MKCIVCGGETENKLVTFSYDENGKFLLVEHVPAEVCNRCGERTYSPEVTDQLLKFAKMKLSPMKTIQVPVFDFAEQH